MLEKIKNIANKKSIKMAAVAALMSVSTVSLAEAKTDLNPGGISKKTETVDPIKEEAETDKTIYNPSEIEMAGMTGSSNFELVKMDFDVNYETDKADLAEQYKKEITDQFINFLDNINEDNFDVAIAADWQVFSSCDERQTNAWGEKGNEALAEARGQSVIEILQEILSEYDFESLSDEQIEALKGKVIGNEIASEHSDRVGEKLIIDVINPSTGENYTAEEVKDLKENDPDKYAELLSENRVSEFRAEILVTKLAKLGIIPSEGMAIEPRPGELITSSKLELVRRFSDYKNIILLLDDSPSMRNDKQKLSDEINAQQEDLANVNLFIGHYSDELKSIDKLQNSTGVEDEIMKNIGSGSNKEHSVQVPIAAWEQVRSEIKDNEKTLILVNTDEALQQFSAEDLKQLAALPNNVKVRFAFHLNEDESLEVSLEVVQNQFNQIMEKKTSIYKSNLKKVEGHLAKLHLRQLQAPTKASKKHLGELIKGQEEKQESYISKIAEVNEKFTNEKITLDEITDENGQVIKLSLYS